MSPYKVMVDDNFNYAWDYAKERSQRVVSQRKV